ncbi:hypothetical protein GQ54DRAFT_299266 [Martensiomyces pterosporus]|nr:hypothetical protein GQ54DRAFT_299266 [Martensiomyces pterosporus]
MPQRARLQSSRSPEQGHRPAHNRNMGDEDEGQLKNAWHCGQACLCSREGGALEQERQKPRLTF